jgi:exodeoxyribonuclease VII large subunit
MQEDGMGSLYTAYEELKKKLEREGLFDESHKKKIPFMPKTIGVLTSNTGAVIRDIINVSTRRNPKVCIRLYPVPVQGAGAGEKIARAIKFMNENNLADVLIVARGGGSLEDLWPFNEEVVARAIYESDLPVISAVGHETDFTIADFVADLRAPTPSAAAELAVTDIVELKNTISVYKNRLKMALSRKTEVMRLRYEKCMNSRAYRYPKQYIDDKYVLVDNRMRKIENIVVQKLKDSKLEATKWMTKLDTLSPLKTLTRGYCLTECEGKLITNSSELKKDMEVDLRFQDGSKTAIIK